MMQRKHVVAASTCALSLMIGTTLHAGQNQGMSRAGQSDQAGRSAMTQPGPTQSGSQREVSALSIDQQMLDQQVRNPQGQDLGKIADAIVDRSGRVQYVLLSPSKAANAESRYIAVPWHAFEGVQNGNWILPMSQDKLAQAPSVSSGQSSAELSRPETVTVVYAFYGIPVSAAGEGQNARFSQLDANQDGYISETEAQSGQRLSDNFQQADSNSDGRIDRSEFSAFETGGTSASGQAGSQSGMQQQTSPSRQQPGSMTTPSQP